MKKKLIFRTLGGTFALLAFTGCGTNDPYSLLQQNYGDMFPPLNAPVPANSSFFVRGFGTSGIDGFQFYTQSAFTGVSSVTAPAAGTVTFIDSSSITPPGVYSVTIFHSPLLSSRISGMASTSILVGAFVNQGDTIGTVPTGAGVFPAIQLDVYVNGGPATCPLSYMSSTARQAFQLSQFGGQFPCIQ